MPDIVIHLGRTPHTVVEGCTLAELVESLGHRPDAVATGRNGDFVRRELRSATVLIDGDQVSVFQPIVGG